MKVLARKVAALLPELEARGKVFLYALGEREDVNGWDVILSADWSDAEYTSAIKIVADALVARLDTSELTMLEGVVIIPSHEPNIRDMPRSLEDASPDEAKIVEMTMMGLDIRRIYIFKAQPSFRESEPAELLTATQAES